MMSVGACLNQVWIFDENGKYSGPVFSLWGAVSSCNSHARAQRERHVLCMAVLLQLNMASQREQILGMLSHMDRPPDVCVEEWQELLVLEAPSILGMAAPQAAALEVSEPTFPSGGSISEEEALAMSDDSLEGYSPSHGVQ